AADRASEEACELLELPEPLLAADAAAAADHHARGIEPDRPGRRPLAARDADAEVLVAQRRREVQHCRRRAAGLRSDRVRRDGEQLRRRRKPGFLEQAPAPALPCE